MKKSKEEASQHLYVGSAIDDSGLSPAQFRILCRVVRRGICWESIPNLSKSLKIGIDQVREAIKELVRHRWIKRTDVIGMGIKLEATINNALSVEDEKMVTPTQLSRAPLFDQTGAPLFDQVGKGYTSKDIPKGKVVSIDRGSKKTNKNNKRVTEYGW